MATPPKAPTAPAAPAAPSAPAAPGTAKKPLTVEEMRKQTIAMFARRGKRVLIYGDAGVGKSTLATSLVGPMLYIDLENTVCDLFDEIPEHITPVTTDNWDELEKWLASDNIRNYKTIVIDSLTTLESIWLKYALSHFRKAPEGYGALVYSEKELPALKDEREFGGGGADSARFAMWTRYEHLLDAIVASGVTVVDLCHVVDEVRDDASEGVNTTHAPRLLNPNNKTGKNSIRRRAIEWHGEVWYMKWETLRKDETHTTRTGRRILLGQPDAEHAQDFDGVESKSRRGFSVSYIEDFDINAVLGLS